jgi:hypothetical protein
VAFTSWSAAFFDHRLVGGCPGGDYVGLACTRERVAEGNWKAISQRGGVIYMAVSQRHEVDGEPFLIGGKIIIRTNVYDKGKNLVLYNGQEGVLRSITAKWSDQVTRKQADVLKVPVKGSVATVVVFKEGARVVHEIKVSPPFFDGECGGRG